MTFRALSVVDPAGTWIRSGQKTLEIRRWAPDTCPLIDVLIVQNGRRLSRSGLEEDPAGTAITLVDFVEVRPWTPADLAVSREDSWEAGWLAWGIANVRRVEYPHSVLARRRLYEVEIDDLALRIHPAPSANVVINRIPRSISPACAKSRTNPHSRATLWRSLALKPPLAPGLEISPSPSTPSKSMNDSSLPATVSPTPASVTPAFPRSGYDTVGGLVFFPRMLHKIRLHAAGQLPPDYNLGTGLDARMCRFLQVDYQAVARQALEEHDDTAVLNWCFAQGRRPSEDDVAYFNAFMTKRGWRDSASEKLTASKQTRGLAHRDDLQTTFDLQDFDEGRK